MKNFVKENWYKLMIGSSMTMASFGFMIYAISPAYSNPDKEKTTLKDLPNNQKVIQVPVNADGSVNVKLSEDQMKELKPPNAIWRFVGTGNGIYYSYDDDPTNSGDWSKIPLK